MWKHATGHDVLTEALPAVARKGAWQTSEPVRYGLEISYGYRTSKKYNFYTG
jgi:hypothetical protein